MQASQLLRTSCKLGARVPSIAYNGGLQAGVSRRVFLARASGNGNGNGTGPSSSSTSVQDPGSFSDSDDCGYNVAGEYCSIEEMSAKRKAKRSLGEMEQDFLVALSSFYYSGTPTMSDEEFALLKEELLWSGSKVPVLDGDEQRFLEASLAYAKGTPILSDQEYDELKEKLRNSNSVVAAQGPRCSIRSKRMYSDANPDYGRMVALSLPGVFAVLGLTFGIDFLTGFQLTNLIELPAPYGVFAVWGLLLPSLFTLAYSLTNVGFNNNLILKGPCPNCGTDNITYFGDVFTVKGNRGSNVVECVSCKADLTFDEMKRVIVVTEGAEVKQEKLAAAAQKKAAAAAKKKAKVAAGAAPAKDAE